MNDLSNVRLWVDVVKKCKAGTRMSWFDKNKKLFEENWIWFL